jgi:hypothetical protein
MDLDTIELRHLEDIGQFERHVAQKAAGMSLEEVEAELIRLPASPNNDRDLIARAVMAKRRCEILDAARPNPNAPPPVDQAGLVDIVVPDGVDVSCIQSRTIMGRYYYRELRGDQWIIRAPWSEFYTLAFGIHNSAGVNGAVWCAANPHLTDRLPKNSPPPIPEAPR